MTDNGVLTCKMYRIMKKNYIYPAVEVIAISAMSALCESKFGPFTMGGGSETIDPETSGI